MPVQHDGLDVQYVDLNGARLAYRIKGSRDKSLMINLHGGRGFGSHGREFAAWKELSDQLCVVAFDFRGHGLSSDTEPYIFAQIVEDIEALRRHLVADRPAIIQGGSFGGFLAQQYALTYPQYTSHLILRGTAPSHHHEAEAKANFLARAAVKAPLASPEMLDKVFGAFQDDTEMRLIMFAIGPLYSEGSYDGNRALEAACTTRYNAKAHNDLYSQTEKYFDYREQLKTLETPTLIIAGANDWITDPAQSRLLHSLIKNSRLVIMPDANHSVHEEKHEEVIALVRQFIQSS